MVKQSRQKLNNKRLTLDAREKGGMETALFLFIAIIGLILVNGFVAPNYNSTPSPQIVKQFIITQTPPPGKKTLQELTFKVETTYAPVFSGNQNNPPQFNPPGNNPPASGYCSPSFLAQYFGGDVQKANVAACICRWESGGNPGSENLNCIKNGKSADYSIGLFQINLVAHCPAPSVRMISSWGPPWFCSIQNQSAVNACTTQYLDPIQNIQKMLAISSNGTAWEPGWTAERGKCF